MIRVLLIAVGFLIVTITLLLLQPGFETRDDNTTYAQEPMASTIEQVTRSNTNLTAITPPNSLPSNDEPATMLSNILNGLSATPSKPAQQPSDVNPFPKQALDSPEGTDPRTLQLMISQALK